MIVLISAVALHGGDKISYHRFVRRLSKTACGRRWSDDWVTMPTRRAKAIADPCRVCYP